MGFGLIAGQGPQPRTLAARHDDRFHANTPIKRIAHRISMQYSCRYGGASYEFKKNLREKHEKAGRFSRAGPGRRRRRMGSFKEIQIADAFAFGRGPGCAHFWRTEGKATPERVSAPRRRLQDVLFYVFGLYLVGKLIAHIFGVYLDFNLGRVAAAGVEGDVVKNHFQKRVQTARADYSRRSRWPARRNRRSRPRRSPQRRGKHCPP